MGRDLRASRVWRAKKTRAFPHKRHGVRGAGEVACSFSRARTASFEKEPTWNTFAHPGVLIRCPPRLIRTLRFVSFSSYASS
eukprot:1666576-Pleurochrysis_carterae.AAC.4